MTLRGLKLIACREWFAMGFLLWRRASYPVFKDFVEKGDVVVLLPTGSIEQHGPHLPLDTDCFLAERISAEVGRSIGEDTGLNALVAPALCPGLSFHWKPFPGTLTLASGTFASLFMDVLGQILSEVTTHVIVVNGHGGNSGLLSTLLDEAMVSYPEAVMVHTDWWRMLGDEGMSIFEEKVFAHAEEVETSLFLALGGELRTQPPRGEPRPWPFSIEPAPGARANIYRSVDLGDGVFGEPALASRDKGLRALEVLRRNYVRLAEMVAEGPRGYASSI